MPEYIGLDFETYGAEDLPTHGLARYTQHKTFQPLIGSVAWRPQGQGSLVKRTFDFVSDRRASRRDLEGVLAMRYIVAHNAPFEQAVLDHLGLEYPSSRFIDSAVVARAAGAASRLEAAAPQLLNINKMEEGKDLIKLFSIPGKYQEDSGSPAFDPQVIDDHPQEWAKFCEYCELDAELSLTIVEQNEIGLTTSELGYAAITMDMNRTGWCVDIPLVEEMQRRYLENQDQALAEFRARYGVKLNPKTLEYDFNLNSLKQMKEWCAARGVKATSFDEAHVTRYLAAIKKKLENSANLTTDQISNYIAVADLLRTKQILGGSSLKKLKVILDTALDMGDGTHRLKDQYLHCGAAQTLRTTGRSVQMQNLKRLGAEIDDVEELHEVDVDWDNEQLARNLRQCFTASHPQGSLIVGDFSSVEARGLAWQAGEDWKLEAFRQGKDLYKVAASRQFSTPYDVVTKDQRLFGKVGELSCGYQAGADAVGNFAAGMGVKLTEAEAAKVVYDWRDSNPKIVDYWADLDRMLHDVVEGKLTVDRLAWPDGFVLKMHLVPSPKSLQRQHPNAQTLAIWVVDSTGTAVLRRYFHGVYVRGRNICYYKPSDRKTGDLWKNNYRDQKTKQIRFYQIYGGKLAGILTQSLCRELFFMVLRQVHEWAKWHSNIELVGQFHDEIVADWQPTVAALSLPEAKLQLGKMMSDPGPFQSFPLAAEIKDDYRYTK